MNQNIPRYIVWSTDSYNQADPFQRRWLLRQVLMYGRADDIRKIDVEDIRRDLDQLHLPTHIDRLWRTYLGKFYE